MEVKEREIKAETEKKDVAAAMIDGQNETDTEGDRGGGRTAMTERWTNRRTAVDRPNRHTKRRTKRTPLGLTLRGSNHVLSSIGPRPVVDVERMGSKR